MNFSPSPKLGLVDEGFYWKDFWESPLIQEAFTTSWEPFRKYLRLTQNTESATQYHLWSLLSLTAAVASNHVYINHGIAGRVLVNLGAVLIGRPGIRKSSAIKFMQRFADSVPLNYGPTDTGNARHGVMAAMQTRWQEDHSDEEERIYTLEELASQNFDTVLTRMGRPRTRPASIYFTSLEMGRLLTSQTRELLDFFADGIEGEPIFYQTKTGTTRIPNPLINMLAATTPGSLPNILPRDAHDHGLLSRLIFVYASRNARSIPIPPNRTEAEENTRDEILERLNRVGEQGSGAILFDQDGEREYNKLYDYAISTREFRLNAYSTRRGIHLARVSALICILRGEVPYKISKEDVGLAHMILIMTENHMDGAYTGLDKSQDGRAHILMREVIESSNDDKMDAEQLSTYLGRAGFKAEEYVRIFEHGIKMDRFSRDGRFIALNKPEGAAKARFYLNNFLRGSQ